jgi:hypothetical protein
VTGSQPVVAVKPKFDVQQFAVHILLPDVMSVKVVGSVVAILYNKGLINPSGALLLFNIKLFNNAIMPATRGVDADVLIRTLRLS